MSFPFRKGPRQRAVNSRAVTSCESTAQLPPDLQDLCERHHVLHVRYFLLSLFDINILRWLSLTVHTRMQAKLVH